MSSGDLCDGYLDRLRQLSCDIASLGDKELQVAQSHDAQLSRLKDELRELQQLCVSQSEKLVQLIACKGYPAHGHTTDVLPPPDSGLQPPPLTEHQGATSADGSTNHGPVPHAAAPRCSPKTPRSCPASRVSLDTDSAAAAEPAEGPDSSHSNPNSYASWLLAIEDFKLDPDSLPDDIEALNDMLQQDRPGLSLFRGDAPLAGPVAEADEACNLDCISAIQSSEPSYSSGAGVTSILEGLDRKLDRKLASKKCCRAPSVLTSMKGWKMVEQPVPSRSASSIRALGACCWNRCWKAIYSFLEHKLWSIIEPAGSFRVKWDLLVLVMLAYICIVGPYTICFGSKGHLTDPTELMDQIINLLFGVDIYLNFRTAIHVDEQHIIRDRKLIVTGYLKSWFLPDVISVIPFDMLLTSSSYGFMKLVKATRVIKLAKVLRLLKVIKVMRVVKNSRVIKQLERVAGHHLFSIMYFVTAAVFILHWIACLFYYAASLKNFSADTWVVIMRLENKSRIERYITALYWAMSTLTTVGYGDVIPGNSSEKIMAMLGMTIGVTIFGYFMGAMSSLLTSMNSIDDRVPRKMQMVDDFLRQRKIPDDLSERIRSFFAYILSRQLHVDEEGIMADLSVPLRAEMVLFLYREALQKVPFFRDKDTQFIVAIVTCLRMEYFSPGDIVVRQGDPGNVMYFIGEGKLDVRLYFTNTAEDLQGSPMLMEEVFHKPKFKASETPLSDSIKARLHLKAPPLRTHNAGVKRKGNNYLVIGQLGAGEYFGEYSCLLGECRTASVVAEDYCELYSLSRQDLDKVFEIWPEMAAEFQTLIEGYVSVDSSLRKMAESSSTFKTNPLWARWLHKAEEAQEDEAVQTDSSVHHASAAGPVEHFLNTIIIAAEPSSSCAPMDLDYFLRRLTGDSQHGLGDDAHLNSSRLSAGGNPRNSANYGSHSSPRYPQGRGIMALDADVLSTMVRRVTSSRHTIQQPGGGPEQYGRAPSS